MQLTILQPCHEQFDKMTPSANGRYCGSCQKTVIDFTSFSDAELVAFFQQYTSGACGRLTQHQLQTTLNNINSKRSRISMAKYIIGFGLSLFIPSKKIHAGVNDALPVQMPSTVLSSIDPLPVTRTITGKISDQEGKGIPAAIIIIKGTTIGTAANIDGEYVLNIPDSIQTNYLLEFSAFGFVSHTVSPSLPSDTITVTMVRESQELMGDVVIVGAICKKTRWQKVKDWFR